MQNIILNINIRDTKQQLRDYVIEFNSKIETTKKGDRVYSQALQTAINLFEYLFKHNQHYQRKNLIPPKFTANNIALSKKMIYNKATAYRHIKRLMKANIIIKKVFRGTNAGFGLEFNPEILIAEVCPMFNEWLLSLIKHFKIDLSEDQQNELKSLRPPLDLINSFHIPISEIATCKHIVFTILKRRNINIDVKSVNNYFSDSSFLQEQGSKGSYLDNRNSEKVEIKKNNTPGPRENLTGEVPKISAKYVENRVDFLYNAASSLLWKNKIFSNDEIHAAKVFIRLFLTSGENISIGIVSHRISNFLKRIALAYKFIARSPERYAANPALYFDPNYKHGFTGTKEWLAKSNQKSESSKEYHSHVKLVVKAANQFLNDPTTATYSKWLQYFSKMKDKKPLMLYTKMIINPNINSHEGLAKIRKEDYGLHN